MQDYTQANRPYLIETALGKDVLLLESFWGSEGVSMPYTFNLSLLSLDEKIAPEDVGHGGR